MRKIFFVLLFISFAARASESPFEISGMDLLKGKEVSLSFKDAQFGTVIVFLSDRCPCSNSYIPTLNDLVEKFGKRGLFQFVGVHSNADEEVEKAQDYFKSKKLVFPVIQDSESKIANLYGANKTPYVVILDSFDGSPKSVEAPKLNILFKGGIGNNSIYLEGKTKNYLREALDAIQNGKKVQDAEVRPIGCVIKRQKK